MNEYKHVLIMPIFKPFICGLLLTSCTLSMQNIDTHGTASDLVDDTQAASPTISPNLNVPVSLIQAPVSSPAVAAASK